MSDTPRTDAAQIYDESVDEFYVTVAFCRQLERECANANRLHLQASENAQMHYSMSAKWAQRARAFESLLQDARDYILNKTERHDLNWHDGHAIIERIDAVMNAAPQAAGKVPTSSVEVPVSAVAAPDVDKSMITEMTRVTAPEPRAGSAALKTCATSDRAMLIDVVRDLIGPRIGETKRAQLAGARQRARAILLSLGEDA